MFRHNFSLPPALHNYQGCHNVRCQRQIRPSKVDFGARPPEQLSLCSVTSDVGHCTAGSLSVQLTRVKFTSCQQQSRSRSTSCTSGTLLAWLVRARTPRAWRMSTRPSWLSWVARTLGKWAAQVCTQCMMHSIQVQLTCLLPRSDDLPSQGQSDLHYPKTRMACPRQCSGKDRSHAASA